MPVTATVNGNAISIDSDENIARKKAIALSQANTDLVELASQPPDQVGAWVDGLPAARKSTLLKMAIIKLSELDRRIAALEARK